MAFKITTVTAFVSVGKDGEEGVMAFHSNDGWHPMVCADEERIRIVFSIAEEISRDSGTPFRILQFSERKDVTDEIKQNFGG